VLPAPGVACWSYGVGMLSIGSKCIADFSWPCKFAARATGEGARLANWGSGEKEKLGLYGMVRPGPVVVGRFREV
jgi:hypothetical protein